MDELPSRQSPRPGIAARIGRFLLAWEVPLAAVVFFCGYAPVFTRTPERGDWLPCYVQAAQRMQAGELLQRSEAAAYMYPPAMAMVTVPLSHLPPRASVAAWYVVNVLALCVLFVSAWRLAGGPALTGLSWRWRIAFWLTLALAGRWLVSPLENKQFDIVIAAFVTAGGLWLARGRDWKGAAAIGVAVAMKCTPLLFLPYLWWRGKWRAGIMVLVTAVSINLLPDFLWPRQTGESYAIEWLQFTTHTLDQQMPGGWWSDPRLNQSLAGMFRRALGWTLPEGEVPSSAVEQTVRWAIYGTAAALLGITAWRFGRPFRAADAFSHQASVPSGGERRRTAVEAAVIMCLMLLLSPMSGKAHYVILLLPLMLSAREAAWGSRGSIILAVGLLVSGPLVSKGFVGREWGGLLLEWGIPTWHVLIALAGLWVMLGRAGESHRRALPHGFHHWPNAAHRLGAGAAGLPRRSRQWTGEL
ncbi:MAG: DUF2029 domain-containing protein [Planctomycetes bacterium]|nr:DUF2029 domain-containing protein [Planctomycetota bacterium]